MAEQTAIDHPSFRQELETDWVRSELMSLLTGGDVSIQRLADNREFLVRLIDELLPFNSDIIEHLFRLAPKDRALRERLEEAIASHEKRSSDERRK